MEKDSRTGSPPMPVSVAVLLSRSTRIHRCVPARLGAVSVLEARPET